MAVIVTDSPGHKLTWLSDQLTGSTGVPALSTMCASTMNAGVLPDEVLVSFTVVTVVPSGPGAEVAVAPTFAAPSFDSPDRSAYDDVGV